MIQDFFEQYFLDYNYVRGGEYHRKASFKELISLLFGGKKGHFAVITKSRVLTDENWRISGASQEVSPGETCTVLEEKLHLAQVWGKVLTQSGVVGWIPSDVYGFLRVGG